jgi:putative ABC transport system substrate-binding protein
VALVLGAAPTSAIAGTDPTTRVFVQALSDLGLGHGHNVVIERRSAQGRPDRMDTLMQEMVNHDVDVIVTLGGPGVRAALRATDRTAIVGLIDNISDTGLVGTWARPGRNFTGISGISLSSPASACNC